MDTELTVNLSLLYNPFDITNVVQEELVYEEGKTLDHYLVGLPTKCNWKIGVNTIPVDEKDWATTKILPEDTIMIVAIPAGGSVKDVLRIVALIAVVVVATLAFGPGGWLGLAGTWALVATATAIAVGSFLVNLALPAGGVKVNGSSLKDDGQSYGFDGAKNTAKEGTPLPVLYGQFQTAGNYVDLYTENVGDIQYMHGRTVLSDGEIDSVVGNPEINEQDISTYTDVEWGYTHGTSTEVINPLFSQSKQAFFREDLLTTSYVQYDTTDVVDAFELDFIMPQGLVSIDTTSGDKKNQEVTVEIQYAPYGTTNWTNSGTTDAITNGYTRFTGLSAAGSKFRLVAQGIPVSGLFNTAVYTVQYRLNGVGVWVNYNTYSDESQSITVHNRFASGDPNYRVFEGSLPDTYDYETSYPQRAIDISLPLGQYEFQIVGSATLLFEGILSTVVAPGSGGSSATTRVRYHDSRTITLRKTYKSPQLIRGRYSIRFRRTTAQSTDTAVLDGINCSGVTEVNYTNVTMKNIATAWFTAKMTDQLSGIPNITWVVKGVKVDIYDNNGVVTANQWSDNPADIVLDMLISQRRGPLRDKVNIDFPAFIQWRNYCQTEGLKFNGVFDTATTLWDALQTVFKVGRAFPVRAGSKLSVGVDKPSTPVMLFGPGNIFKDTFQIQYLGMQDRANEFEVTYYDRADRNKAKTLRIADPTAAQAGEIPKTVQYELFGIDNFTQAQKEVWYQLYNNRLARRVLTFDAPIESIGLSLGDLAYIQHDMVDWGAAGRLVSGDSTTQVTLDRDVALLAGNTYTLLVTHDKISRATCNISFVTGTTYNLTSLTSGTNPVDTLKRIQSNTNAEAEILDFSYTSGTTATVTLSQTITGTTATIWDVDVIEERTVTTAPTAGTHTITVSAPFSITPATYANYMLGINTIVKKPYRLRAINGDGYERRTLTFVEYNAYIYSAPETVIPAPAANPSVFPVHITNLTLSTDPFRIGDTIFGYLSWSSVGILNYGGADIYESTNGLDYTYAGTANNSNNFTLRLRPDQQYWFRVNSFTTTGMRANVNTAPVATKVIVTSASKLVSPTALAWTLGKVNFFADGWFTWTLADSSLGNVSPITRVQVKFAGTTDWLDKGLTDQTKLQLTNAPAGVHSVQIRAENGTGQISDWVTTTFTISVPTVVAPTIANDGTAIDHVINTDGSADISFEWSWSGNESDIDGFELVRYSSTSSADYVIGTTPAAESVDKLAANKRAVVLQGVAANQYYTFYIRAFKNVDVSFAANGVLRSTAVKSAFTGEHPYQPASSVAFTGSIVGTLNTTDINIWSQISGTGKPEDGAEVTRWIDNPVQRLTFNYDYAGTTAESGEFPRDINFKLMTSAGQIVSGITWTYLIITGGLNTFTSASGVKSMTGSDTGTLTVSSLQTSNATIQVTATYNSKPYTINLDVAKSLAAPPATSGGGGVTGLVASKSSGFTSISSTTFTDITGAITGTPAATTVHVNVNLDAMPVGSSNGAWTVEMKVMRDISGTPTQIGTTQSANSDYVHTLYDIYGDSASFSFVVPDTSLTSGTTYTWRIYGRLTSGARGHTISGSVTVTT